MFHPSVQAWFESSFAAATPVQSAAWEKIRAGHNVLIAAPTGSGKTFAAFLCAINDLVTRSRVGPLPDAVQVLYVSPLKALSNDIEKNLQVPLGGVEDWLLSQGERNSGIRMGLRTGDTTPGEREQMRRQPPHILVTTPESLYLLLTSASGRAMLSGVTDIIVDEIHAVAGSKRGSHLSLSLARLDALLPKPARRIGLSATQKPIADIADFLCNGRECTIIDTGHQRERDLQLELTASPLSAVMSNEAWEEIYQRLNDLILAHSTTLVFVNTRRLAERVARHLSERLGEEAVTAHHGSLSRSHRLEAEQALKTGRLRALVATASLELGIDIGHVDLVCQIGSPGSISAFIQRVGRSGHRIGETPKGRLFPLSRDDLVECIALFKAVSGGALDRVSIPEAPLDVLAQHIVAETSAREWTTEDLYKLACSAWPYRRLARDSFDDVVAMLAQGYATQRGRRAAYVYHDAVNGRLKGRPNARLTALQNGGAIPDQFDYEVVLQPQGFRIGTLNEDFAFETLAGDIFQLGNTSYRILKVEQGRVLVEDARGQPPTIPFWLGDRPGRSDELSTAVSEMCDHVQRLLRTDGPEAAGRWLRELGIGDSAAQQAVDYLSAVFAALGCIPTHHQFVLERFFDDTGDLHLVLHAPLGSRIMRAWGLALRKRFCRQFNFELQAAAVENSLILSLGETHSFEIDSIPRYLNSASVREVLVQALLDAPMFNARWRWNATTALAIPRMRNGQKVPPQWQRNQADDLIAVIFPDQLACAENLRGEREIPHHPLVDQTIGDCLHDTMDVVGLEGVLKQIESGLIEFRCLDLTAPSPLAAEIINARPYAFLDDGDAENRRTRAISQNGRDLEDAGMLSIISVPAIDQVKSECWISPRNADELHDGLLQLGFLTAQEFTSGCASTGARGDASRWGRWFQELADDGRAYHVADSHGADSHLADSKGLHWWVSRERLAEFLSLNEAFTVEPDPGALPSNGDPDARETALLELLRSRLAGLGPVRESTLASDLGVPASDVRHALLTMQRQGYAVRMAAPDADHEHEWCERRLLARIHRYSRERRRQNSRAVSPAAFMRFLVQWHGLDAPGTDIGMALSPLEGWTAPVMAWEPELLRARCREFSPQALDQMILSGSVSWFRPIQSSVARQQIVAATPITLVPRRRVAAWLPDAELQDEELPGAAQSVLDLLRREGAMFTEDLQERASLLRPQLEQALETLVARGLVNADAFAPLRWLLRPEASRHRYLKRNTRRGGMVPGGTLGRWSAIARAPKAGARSDQADIATMCEALLRRYGVVFRAVLERESLVPGWGVLLRYLRRMEDRGEVHGGRFVDGFSGEQFALPEAVGLLSRQAASGEPHGWVVISAADPLNLGGIITPGVKTPAVPGNRLLLRDGLAVARLMSNEVELLSGDSSIDLEQARRRLTTVRSLAGNASAP